MFTRARACKQEDSGNRIERAGRRPFEKDDNIWWRYRDDHLSSPFILSPNRGNPPSLQNRLVREYIYIVSIKVFFFFFSSAATLAPDANQYRRVNTFRDPVFLQSRE